MDEIISLVWNPRRGQDTEHHSGRGEYSITHGGCNRRAIKAEATRREARSAWLFEEWKARVNRHSEALIDLYYLSYDNC
jgi:hypothetical protein